MTTGEPDEGENNSNVRKHPAPEGALRLDPLPAPAGA